MHHPKTWRRIVRCTLVAVPALVAILASCTEGAGGRGEPGAPASSHRRPGAAIPICSVVPAVLGPVDAGSDAMATDAVVIADGPGSDAMPIDAPAPDGPGSDAMTIDAPAPDGPGSDAMTVDASVPPDGPGSDGGTGDGGMSCRGLDIVESSISLAPAGSATAEVRSVPSFTDQLVAARITGAGFVFTTPGCGPQLCNFASMPRPLPFVLTIMCTATGTGELRAEGTQGMDDYDIAALSCAGSGPAISVSPPMITLTNVPVGMTADAELTVENTGTAPLMFTVNLPAGAPDWTSTTACTSSCTLAPGAELPIPVQYAPSAPGPSNATISITSNAGPASVDLIGSGLGSRIAVTDPPAPGFAINVGTIPRNSTATRPISVTAIGNLQVALGASVPPPAGPFSVAPPQLTLAPGVPEQLTVSCSSMAATGPIDRTIVLSPMNAYAIDTTSISVRCEVANTQVMVDPNQFDFPEVRKGAPRTTLAFTITNPGPLAAEIGAVELADAPGPLAMALDGGGGFPRTLPVGGTITGRLTLSTDEDLDLAATDPALRISVDGEQLVYPITGKVTTPAAYVTPEKLELGTACIGSDATATVTMINSGTARLMMEGPQVGAAFTIEPQSPPGYPAPLLAGTMATIGVAPAAEAPGELAGTLTWAVDAPDSPFVIPASLTLIETGTAISPAGLTFSPTKVKETSIRYPVTLQNCSTSPVMVTVDGVTASRGGLAAWKVEPSRDARTLAPQDKLTISVAFAPLRHGRHVAQLQLGVDGEREIVTLEGEGIDLDFERTSFYACGCNTPRVRTGGPILLAIAIVAFRRRRRRRRRSRRA